MYFSILVSLFSGVFFSGYFINGFEVLLVGLLVPLINYIRRMNNNPYQLKITYYNKDYNQNESENNDEDEEEEVTKDEDEEVTKDEDEEVTKDEDEEVTKDEDEEVTKDEHEKVTKEEGTKVIEINDETINDLLNKINSVNNKSNTVYLDEKLD